MEFKIKSLSEVDALTPEEKQEYFTALEKNRREETQKTVESLVSEKTEALLDQIKKLESSIGKLSEEDKKEGENEVKYLQDQIKSLSEQLKTVDETVIKLGEVRKSIDIPMTRVANIQKQLIEGLSDAISKAEGNPQALNGVSFVLKDDASDTHTISDVPTGTYPAGSPSNVDALMLQTYGQRVGSLWAAPLRKLNLLDYVNVQTLTGQYLLRDMLYNAQGDAEFVEECGIKPIVLEDVKTESVKAGKVALRFRMTEEYQKFVPEFVKNRMMERFEEKLDIKLIDAMFGNIAGFTGIITNASAYVPVADHQIFTAPNHLDAIASAVNSVELLDYTPSVIVLNPADKLPLLNAKGSDQHYSVFNSGSIQLVQGRLAYVNGEVYPLVFDKTVPQGSLFIASQDTYEIAADNQILVRIGYDKDGDLSRNILTIVLEKFVAVSAPSEVGAGLMFDTFDNIKTAITTP